MFVQDGRPCFHYHFPLERHEIRGGDALTPGGPHDHVDPRPARAHLGAGRAVGGRRGAWARVDIPRIMRGWMPFSGMNVGCDNGAPVATTYESPFRFTGTLHRVDIQLRGEQRGPDAATQHRAEMGTQ